MKRQVCHAYGRSEMEQVLKLMGDRGWGLDSFQNRSTPGVNKPHFELIFVKEEEHEEG
jgi:hypothetical protein